MKTRYCFLEFSYKNNIHNSCNLPNSCFNYLVNPQTLNDARRKFFKRWLVIAIFELLSVVFRSWREACSTCTKVKVNWVLFLRQHVLVCGYWCCAENQYNKITGFLKNYKEEYVYYGFSINSLQKHQAIY